ncbi:hypothetical protein V8C35DRAFT_20835 [Trichoderma chlorosporum]
MGTRAFEVGSKESARDYFSSRLTNAEVKIPGATDAERAKFALCRINKAAQSPSSSDTTLSNVAPVKSAAPPPVKGRIIVISVSDSEPSQYILLSKAELSSSLSLTLNRPNTSSCQRPNYRHLCL